MSAEALRALAHRVCKERPSRELDMLVSMAIGRGDYETHVIDYVDGTSNRVPWRADNSCRHYTTSLDAAHSVLPANWRVQQVGEWSSHLLRQKGAWQCIVEPVSPETGPLSPCWDTRCDHAPTEAQARVAAALLAHAKNQDACNYSTQNAMSDVPSQLLLDPES